MKSKIVNFISLIIGSFIYLKESKDYIRDYEEPKNYETLNEMKDIFNKQNSDIPKYRRLIPYKVKKPENGEDENAKN